MGITEQLWDFPVEFTLKTIGHADAPLTEIVTEIVSRYVKDFDASTISLKASAKGSYVSVTACMRFEDKAQVEGVYRDLNDHDAIVWSL
jgi:putative lipoic acid-binding regulatory protein